MKKILTGLFMVFMVSQAHAEIFKLKLNTVNNRIGSFFDYVNNLSSTSIGDFVDVSTVGALTGDCLIFNSATGIWSAGSCGSGGGGSGNGWGSGYLWTRGTNGWYQPSLVKFANDPQFDYDTQGNIMPKIDTGFVFDSSGQVQPK